MKVPNQRREPFVGANMTPMIDVVFLLIVFFLVSSHLARQESRLPVELPTAASVDPLVADPVALTITVDRDQQVLVGGDSMSRETLDTVLATVAQEEGAAAAIRIRTDEAVPYAIIEPVLKAAARQGLLDIKLAVREK